MSETCLEYMECLELNILALVSKEIHHHLQIRLVGDVPRHHIEVGSIQEDLSEELQRLPLRHVVGRQDKCSVRGEELQDSPWV